MPDFKVPRELQGSGLESAFYRTLYRWYLSPIDDSLPEDKRLGMYFRKFFAHLFFSKVGPFCLDFVSKLTAYYPFSLLFSDKLYHANNVKARNLMRGMEKVAAEKKMPIFIKHGYADRDFSVFFAVIEKRGHDKEKFLNDLQLLFQEKFGDVYVQNQQTGFRILVSNQLMG